MEKTTIKKILIAVIVVIGIYLYFSYSNIYNSISIVGLKPSDIQHTYIMGKDNQSLIYAAIGDSFTAGVGVDKYENSYPYLVSQKLANNNIVTFKDFSISGGETKDLIANLLYSAIATNPDIVTVLIGMNDIHSNVTGKDFEDNYRHIINELQEKTSAKIYLISIPYTVADNLFRPPYNSYFKQKIINFNKIINDLSQSYGLEYIDIATPTESAFAKAGEYYSSDSFHPSGEGYKLWANIIYDNINR